MDQTERKMTKIAREVGKFTVQTMKEEGIGTAEFEFIHLVRHNPGITQTEVRENSKAEIETIFYEWLLAELPEDERNRFCETLDKLYWRSKNERRVGFETVSKLVAERQKEGKETESGDF